ncbi:ammonium transporter [Carboxydocella sporoproducens DSM 16521]|uniref:Ammonium transporter n=2 Tax=Carboxydocella TaxID=178898 RepID=A0A1T4PR82_9FIRM|nr:MULTISPECIES: ammonium transporter [Carboxydocella]AVX19681.1 ammonium transporter [Carboxydocella thermautotrophica]SJZ94090.1 ammonium transporter [Carboxydocella sporoproducens DSM 16521]
MELNLQNLSVGLDTIWVLLAAALVFFMEAGFAALEAGFVRSKNTLNIIMKVLMDCALGLLAYWAIGFGLMYGQSNGWFGRSGFFLQGDFSFLGLNIPVSVFWLFQAAFAVAVATIVSGAVAERMKFSAYLIFSAVATGLIYPLAAGWVWNSNGWLHNLGMLDFAGSAAVHAVGGWASLAAAMVLGPRLGKYGKDGTINAIPGHNIPLAALGGFILWFGWFGFNAGSTLSALHKDIGLIALNTNLAAAAGGTMGCLYTMFRFGKADVSMAINGALAGLVAITAGCAYLEPAAAVAVGLIAGLLVVEAIGLFDRLRIDDPVGAIAVHGVGGSFGTLAVGLLAKDGGLFYGGGWHLFQVQLIGLLAVSVFAFAATYLLFRLLAATIGIRVSAEEELEGLDIAEHGFQAYNELVNGSFSTAALPSVLAESWVEKVETN